MFCTRFFPTIFCPPPKVAGEICEPRRRFVGHVWHPRSRPTLSTKVFAVVANACDMLPTVDLTNRQGLVGCCFALRRVFGIMFLRSAPAHQRPKGGIISDCKGAIPSGNSNAASISFIERALATCGSKSEGLEESCCPVSLNMLVSYAESFSNASPSDMGSKNSISSSMSSLCSTFRPSMSPKSPSINKSICPRFDSWIPSLSEFDGARL